MNRLVQFGERGMHFVIELILVVKNRIDASKCHYLNTLAFQRASSRLDIDVQPTSAHGAQSKTAKTDA